MDTSARNSGRGQSSAGFDPAIVLHHADVAGWGARGLDQETQRVDQEHPSAVGAGARAAPRGPRRQAIPDLVQPDRVVNDVLGVESGLGPPRPDPWRSHARHDGEAGLETSPDGARFADVHTFATRREHDTFSHASMRPRSPRRSEQRRDGPHPSPEDKVI